MYYLPIILALALSVFSFTFVDLNLTLINWPPYLAIQQQATQLGYFNRSINGSIQAVLFVSLLLTYVLVSQIKWHPKTLLRNIVVMGAVLTIGYTAYSHDLFNYIFDARMVTTYGVNPYEYKALDFPQDDWTRFMQWTHRTYPYGPAWLLITLIPSYLGLGKFLLTYILFKLIFFFAYLFGAYSIYKISQILSSQQSMHINALVLYAFNPLILIDGILSPHLDMLMATLGLIGIWCILKARNSDYVAGTVAILVAAGIKFATLPWLIIANKWFIAKVGSKIFCYSLVTISFLLGIVQAISQYNYQPWYGLLAAACLPILTPYIRMKYLVIAGILLSLPMWIYVHHAYTGNWASAIPLF